MKNLPVGRLALMLLLGSLAATASASATESDEEQTRLQRCQTPPPNDANQAERVKYIELCFDDDPNPIPSGNGLQAPIAGPAVFVFGGANTGTVFLVSPAVLLAAANALVALP